MVPLRSWILYTDVVWGMCVYMCVCTHDDARAFIGVRGVCIRLLYTYTDSVLWDVRGENG